MMTNPQIRLTDLAHGGGCGCKIAPGVLRDILSRTSTMVMPPELMVGIETSDDAAVYKLNDEQALVATTDFFMPVVDDPFDFGRIAATNSISDVYAMGAQPILALALVGMPVNVLSPESIAQILEGGQSVCKKAGIPVAGGHTIDSVEPIYGLVVLGLAHPSRIRTNASARAGDVLILGKPLGVGIYSSAFKKQVLNEQGYRDMVSITTQLNTPGSRLSALDAVHAMTDVTGFGLAGHALELARGAKLDVHLDWHRVPLLPQAKALAQAGCITGASTRNQQSYFNQIDCPHRDWSELDSALVSDPQTSGGLLVSCSPSAVEEVLAIFHAEGFHQAAVMGRMELPAESSPRVRIHSA